LFERFQFGFHERPMVEVKILLSQLLTPTFES
jgi:hypothetical protein